MWYEIKEEHKKEFINQAAGANERIYDFLKGKKFKLGETTQHCGTVDKVKTISFDGENYCMPCEVNDATMRELVRVYSEDVQWFYSSEIKYVTPALEQPNEDSIEPELYDVLCHSGVQGNGFLIRCSSVSLEEAQKFAKQYCIEAEDELVRSAKIIRVFEEYKTSRDVTAIKVQ